MRAKLETFLPGGWLDDVMLMLLLQQLCKGNRLYVVDSLKLDIANPLEVFRKMNVHDDYDGLILPFNVNMGNQAFSDKKNHWIIAIANWRDLSFTSFGIDRSLAEQWGAEFQSALKSTNEGEVDVKCQIKKVSVCDSDSNP
jgi:hypothetical protein